EGVERLEQLEEHVLGQVLGLIVLADELVGDVEDAPPVQADDGLPGRLVAVQAALDDLVDRVRLGGRGGTGNAGRGGECREWAHDTMRNGRVPTVPAQRQRPRL